MNITHRSLRHLLIAGAVWAVGFPFQAVAKISMPVMFGDGMVLQRDMPQKAKSLQQLGFALTPVGGEVS